MTVIEILLEAFLKTDILQASVRAGVHPLLAVWKAQDLTFSMVTLEKRKDKVKNWERRLPTQSNIAPMSLFLKRGNTNPTMTEILPVRTVTQSTQVHSSNALPSSNLDSRTDGHR